MKKLSGFTVIELLVVVVILITAGLLFINQKSSLEATARDEERKVDINTLYHNLTKIYYKEHESYPTKLDSESLPAVPSETFKDPRGITINEKADSNLNLTKRDSDYSYKPVGCDQETNECQGFTLKATLENEAHFIKKVEIED